MQAVVIATSQSSGKQCIVWDRLSFSKLKVDIQNLPLDSKYQLLKTEPGPDPNTVVIHAHGLIHLVGLSLDDFNHTL